MWLILFKIVVAIIVLTDAISWFNSAVLVLIMSKTEDILYGYFGLLLGIWVRCFVVFYVFSTYIFAK